MGMDGVSREVNLDDAREDPDTCIDFDVVVVYGSEDFVTGDYGGGAGVHDRHDAYHC
ncbi:hypothetical protein FRB94_014750 [Tulasnella sp. JGI-2019a]|nr:hypothetical protein FRB94_014750 [Tulasnella sp. JGI-2019a]